MTVDHVNVTKARAECGDVGGRSVVRLRRAEPALMHSYVIAAATGRILGQDSGEMMTLNPGQALRLVEEHPRGKLGAIAMEDPHPVYRQFRRHAAESLREQR